MDYITCMLRKLILFGKFLPCLRRGRTLTLIDLDLKYLTFCQPVIFVLYNDVYAKGLKQRTFLLQPDAGCFLHLDSANVLALVTIGCPENSIKLLKGYETIA